MLRLRSLALCALLGLAGCAADRVRADDEAVTRSVDRHDAAPRLTLYRMISNRSSAGAHSSLMLGGLQRLIHNPANSSGHETIPERDEVLHGLTPPVEDVDNSKVLAAWTLEKA